MDLDDDSLATLKTGADIRMRAIVDDALAKTNLAHNLLYFVGLLAAGVVGVTVWVGQNNRAIEKVNGRVDISEKSQKENRDYIRELWRSTFKQPLPPPPATP